MVQKFEFIVPDNGERKRLDAFISEQNVRISRSQVKRLIDTKFIKVNEMFTKASFKLTKGDLIKVSIPDPVPAIPVPEDIPLEIIYEDSFIIVVNKPAGLVVHPASGNYSHTLVNALLYYSNDLSGIGGVIRPGIVHRLDKNTSGVLVVAKSDFAHKSLATQFEKHSITRRYTGIAYGIFKDEKGTITSLIGRHPVDRKRMSTKARSGKKAVTHWKVIKQFDEVALLEINLETGRTHQIRVHLADIQHPIIGDPVYCSSKKLLTIRNEKLRVKLKELNRQALHASILGFNHPETGEYMEFSAPLPKDVKNILHYLNSEL
ncbi:MAG: RluA family pseudouridine synthase [Pseudomonadota bacterium]